MFQGIDLIALPIAEIAEIAIMRGVAFHLNPGDPSSLIIHPHRDPAIMPLVNALRHRREELACFLIRHRPSMPAISERERWYRSEVLCEPDVLIGELTWPILAAMVISTVLDVLDAERTRQAWEASIDGRDATPQARSGRQVRL